jgi:hypothetical protein
METGKKKEKRVLCMIACEMVHHITCAFIFKGTDTDVLVVKKKSMEVEWGMLLASVCSSIQQSARL